MKAVVTGGTGLVGRALLAKLPDAVVLSRDPAAAAGALGGARVQRWAPAEEPAPASALEGVDVVYNLAGEPIGEGRWTADKKRRIRESRVIGTRNLVAGIAAVERRPSVLVSGSAIGVYGDRGDEVLDEGAAPGNGFLAEVCLAWEEEARAAEALGVRVVHVRLGIVLARAGGALAKMLGPFRMGAGGRIGGGAQWMSWIHLDDVVGLLLHAGRTALHGPLNVVAPEPATNADFTRALGHALHRPTLLPVPRAALRIAFGEMSELLLDSQRVVPKAALASGYAFRHPALASALADLVGR